MALYNKPLVNRAASTSGITTKLNAMADKLLALPWLSRTFAQAVSDQNNEGNNYPIAFSNTVGETPLSSYIDLSPSKMLVGDNGGGAYSFFRLRDPITFNDPFFGRNANEVEVPVSLVVWADLNRIDSDAGYIVTNELIEDVINTFSLIGGVTLSQIFLDPPSVWDGYTFTSNDYQLVNKHPYASFRIDFTVRTNTKCA
jgi:hypothetical protein